MESFYSQTAQCHVRCHDFPGEGTPIVFIHGLGCASSYDYPRVASDPTLVEHRTILVDLPGSGYSEKPDEYDYSTTSQARVVIELLRHLQLPSCWLYGHSMGGSIAIEVVSNAPELICGLMVSEPNFHSGGGEFSLAIASHSLPEFEQNVWPGFLKDVSTPWAGCLLSHTPMGVWRSAKSLIEGVNPSWYQRFQAIEKPKLLIFGEHSLPDNDFTALAAQGICTAVIPNAAHSIAWQNPPALAAAIHHFIK